MYEGCRHINSILLDQMYGGRIYFVVTELWSSKYSGVGFFAYSYHNKKDINTEIMLTENITFITVDVHRFW